MSEHFKLKMGEYLRTASFKQILPVLVKMKSLRSLPYIFRGYGIQIFPWETPKLDIIFLLLCISHCQWLSSVTLKRLICQNKIIIPFNPAPIHKIFVIAACDFHKISNCCFNMKSVYEQSRQLEINAIGNRVSWKDDLECRLQWGFRSYYHTF